MKKRIRTEPNPRLVTHGTSNNNTNDVSDNNNNNNNDNNNNNNNNNNNKLSLYSVISIDPAAMALYNTFEST